MDRRGRAGARPLGLRRAPLRQPSHERRYLAERSVDSYWRYYQIHYPIEELELGARRAALAALSPAQGARTPCSARASAGSGPTGSRRPAPRPSTSRPSRAGPTGSARSASEHAAPRERAVLIDQSSFSKYEITGPRRASPPCSGSPPTTSTSRRARSSTRSSATSAAASRPTSPSPGSTRTASTW